MIDEKFRERNAAYAQEEEDERSVFWKFVSRFENCLLQAAA